MMKKELQGLKTGLLKIIVYSLVLVLVAELIRRDAINSLGQESKFDESSMTELTQSLVLIISAGVYLFAFIKFDTFKPLSLSLFAFTFASFIREQDSFMDDYVFDGAWQTAVFIVFAIVLYYIIRHFKGFLHSLDLYIPSASFGIFITGFLTTYVFSRLYGRTVFWKAVMEDNYIRSVKNASEECIELLGYSILIISAFEFYLLVKNNLKEPPKVASAGPVNI